MVRRSCSDWRAVSLMARSAASRRSGSVRVGSMAACDEMIVSPWPTTSWSSRASRWRSSLCARSSWTRRSSARCTADLRRRLSQRSPSPGARPPTAENASREALTGLRRSSTRPATTSQTTKNDPDTRIRGSRALMPRMVAAPANSREMASWSHQRSPRTRASTMATTPSGVCRTMRPIRTYPAASCGSSEELVTPVSPSARRASTRKSTANVTQMTSRVDSLRRSAPKGPQSSGPWSRSSAHMVPAPAPRRLTGPPRAGGPGCCDLSSTFECT